MKCCRIFLVAKTAQESGLARIRSCKHSQSLVGVRGDNDTVKFFHLPPFQAHSGGGLGFRHLDNFGWKLNRLKVGKQLIPVAAGTPANREPWMMSRHT